VTAGIAAFGTELKINSDVVGELTSMEAPSVNTDYVDLTHHASPGAFKEYAPSLRDGEEIAIEGNYVPGDTGQAALRAANLAGSLDTYTVTFPQSLGAFTFTAYAKNIKPKAPHDGKLGFTGALKVTGEPTFA
jgi:predicted secreted protein